MNQQRAQDFFLLMQPNKISSRRNEIYVFFVKHVLTIEHVAYGDV